MVNHPHIIVLAPHLKSGKLKTICVLIDLIWSFQRGKERKWLKLESYQILPAAASQVAAQRGSLEKIRGPFPHQSCARNATMNNSTIAEVFEPTVLPEYIAWTRGAFKIHVDNKLVKK